MTLAEEVQRIKDSLIPGDIVGIGARATGHYHLGNLNTTGLAVMAAQMLDRTVIFDFNDYAMPVIRDWIIAQNGFVRYSEYLDAPDMSGRSLLEYMTGELKFFLMKLEEGLEVPIEIRFFSNLQREESFRAGVKRVLETPSSNQIFYNGPDLTQDMCFVFPLCPKCHTSNPEPSIYRSPYLITECTNPSCNVQDYEVDIMDCSVDISPHYLLGMARDVLLSPKVGVHFLGRDYEELVMPRLDKKVEATRRITEMASGQCNAPPYIITPMIYARSGTKMGKSMCNGVTITDLVDNFGPSYVERVIEFCQMIAARPLAQDVGYHEIKAFLNLND